MPTMPPVENVPTLVAGITLVAGGALALAPQVYTGPVGLDDGDLEVRVIGVADLVLVPGLLAGRPRWPWMAARAGLSFAQGAHLGRVAPRARKAAWVNGSAATLFGLSVMDAATALLLRRAGR